MGMIVIMIRWVCFIDHAFRPAMPPAHNALPMRRGGGPASQAATTAATAAGQLAGYRWAKNRPPT
ncbi:MAG: hypothetical protein ACFNVT_03235 [Corynebacterium matruchotii]|uniref:hypothetical protein n=1 Tax=Corynebacterium matruchotii TaxID=43768 RepID=UPI0036162494